MARATKRSRETVRGDLIALATGHFSGDPGALLDRVARSLLQGASAELQRTHSSSEDSLLSQKRMRGAVAASLREILLHERQQTPPASTIFLPVTKLSPEEVVAQTGISKSTLYRGDGSRFYSVVPTGMQNGRAYPAWQFVGEVPSLMPPVLSILTRKTRIQVNSFMLSEQDSLNELSPAEVLSGMAFEDRGELSAAQARMLSLSQEARINKVMMLAKLEVADSE
jgi:hypothetical protein